LAVGHLLYLHVGGSSNPVGTTSDTDRTTFHPYYSFKDLITVYVFFVTFGFIVFFAPDKLGHSDNYIEANSMQTPPSIVPEWYLLPFYAILRSIPNKLLGVIAMFIAILILLVLPFTDTSNIKGNTFKPIHIFAFWIFVLNFIILMWLGSCHVEAPFILAGQLATAYYFSHYIIHLPILGIADNVLGILATEKIEKTPNIQINSLWNKMTYFVISDVNFLQEDLYCDLSNFSNIDYKVFFVSIFFIITIIIFLSLNIRHDGTVITLHGDYRTKDNTKNGLKVSQSEDLNQKKKSSDPIECSLTCVCLSKRVCMKDVEPGSLEWNKKIFNWIDFRKDPYKFKKETPVCGWGIPNNLFDKRGDVIWFGNSNSFNDKNINPECNLLNDFCPNCTVKVKEFFNKKGFNSFLLGNSLFSYSDFHSFYIIVIFLCSALVLYLFHKKEMKNITINKYRIDQKFLNNKPTECPVKCDCLRKKLCLLGVEEDSPEMKKKSVNWKEMVKNPFKFKDNTPICGRKDIFCGIRNDYCAVCTMKMKNYLEKQRLIDKENIKNLIIVVGVSSVIFFTINSLIIT
jgi:hypothetical protein